jgi:hypothetical protein
VLIILWQTLIICGTVVLALRCAARLPSAPPAPAVATPPPAVPPCAPSPTPDEALATVTAAVLYSVWAAELHLQAIYPHFHDFLNDTITRFNHANPSLLAIEMFAQLQKDALDISERPPQS